MSVESLLQDARFAIRQLRRSPLTTIAALVTLALGIGATAAVFSVVNAWLLRPLPLTEPQQLVAMWRTAASNPHEPAYFDFYRDYLVWASDNRTLRSLAATFPEEYTISGAGEPRQIHGAIATWNLFDTVGGVAARGRLFSASDVRQPASCVLSHAFWQQQFGGSPAIVGQVIHLNDSPYRVLGVLPANFSLRVLDRPFDIDVWTLITDDDRNHTAASTAPVSVIGRLQPGVAAAQAEADLNRIQGDLNRRYSDEPPQSGVLVAGLQQDNTRTVRSSLLLLLGAVAVLLLIACVNAGSLVLGRNSQRAGEFAVRLALGCGARRLFQQLTVETFVLFTCSGALGVAGAYGLVRLFVAANPVNVLPPGGISVDASVLAMSAAVVCISALLFGSIPAARALRAIDADALRARSATVSGAHLRLRMGFVVVEMTLTVVLLIAAGVLIEGFIRASSRPLGFHTRGVYVGEVALPLSRYPTVEAQSRFVDQLLPKLRGLAWIHAVGVSSSWPFQANGRVPLAIEGRPSDSAHAPHSFVFDAGPGYFEALGTPVLLGRAFLATDRAGTPGVAVVNRAFADLAFPGASPVGQRLRIGSLSRNTPDGPWLTVVGMVANTGTLPYNRTAWEVAPAIYTAFLQRADPQRQIHRFATQTIYLYLQARALDAAAVPTAVHAIDPDVPVPPLRSTGAIVSELRSQPRLRVSVLGGFATLTLLLAIVGIYGVMTQFVEQRRREIGIRVALGAQRRDVLKGVLRRSLMLVFAGLVMGIAIAAVAMRVLRGMLDEISASDPWVIVAVAGVLATVAMLASFFPARRASRIDPIITLRRE